jgi:hypothetical protein
MKVPNRLMSTCTLMTAYHIEQLSEQQYKSEFNSITIYEKPKYELCEQLAVLLEEQKSMQLNAIPFCKN